MKPVKNVLLRVFPFLFFILISTSLIAETRILFLGDSITAGYGIEKTQAYPFLVDKALKKSGYKNIKVINAGISGSTSASAVSRLKWYLRIKPDILVLALGGNDGLRGLSVKEMKANLEKTIQLALQNKLRIILAGMEIPTNYGPKYMSDFRGVFRKLADNYPVTFMPFLLKDVGGIASLNLPDGIHPTPEGHQIIADNIMKYILETL
ncbi:arylesterase [bacterium]|nr:arylesterase [bacterium]